MTDARRTKNKVHEDTPLVRNIEAMSKYCRSRKTIAKTLGCHSRYVEYVLHLKRSSAHVFLSKNTLENMR